jgi:hypothetical protein
VFGGAIARYSFVLLVDPYDIVAFSLPLDRASCIISATCIRKSCAAGATIACGRDIDRPSARSCSCRQIVRHAFWLTSPWIDDGVGQQTMIDYFSAKRGAAEGSDRGLEIVWCDQHADRNSITFGFPTGC